MMEKLSKAIVLTVIFTLGIITPVVNAQQNIIDKLEVVSIKTIQIRPEENTIFMDLEVAIANTNEKEIRLRNGKFTFFLHSKYNDPAYYENAPRDSESIVSEGIVIKEDGKRKIGTAKRHGNNKDITLASTKDDPPNIVKFRVDIGKSQSQAFDVMAHMMNCIGYRKFKDPRINIEGTFELGVRSDKGWSMVESVKIEWNFCPETPLDVDFFPGMSCSLGK